jgi:hypothetical protein
MPKIWPHDTIRELLALAEATGESSAELASEREAELFRFAIYSFRREQGIGHNLSVTLDGCRVVVTKRETPTVVILQGQEAS